MPHFTGKRLQDVTRADVERFLSSKRRWARGTRNRYLLVVSAIYKRAIAMGYVEDNPAAKVARAKETRTPLPLMILEDQDRLVEAVSDEVRLLVLFGMDTGKRLGEILRLVWRDVDAAEGAILVRKTKAHHPRAVKMSSRLRAAFFAAPRPLASAPDQRIFGPLVGRGGRFRSVHYRAYQAAAATIGFPGLRFQDLRHVTAINLVRGGLDLPAVQATLGHASLQSTLRYAESADESASSRAAAVLDRMRHAVVPKAELSPN